MNDKAYTPRKSKKFKDELKITFCILIFLSALTLIANKIWKYEDTAGFSAKTKDGCISVPQTPSKGEEK